MKTATTGEGRSVETRRSRSRSSWKALSRNKANCKSLATTQWRQSEGNTRNRIACGIISSRRVHHSLWHKVENDGTYERNVTTFAKNGDGKKDRENALVSVLADIDASFGKGSIMRLGSEANAKGVGVETFSTGAMTLDRALGGGLPRGRIVEVYGPESSGKTTLAMHAIAEMQKNGEVAALIDAEHAFDPQYCFNLGVDVDNLYLCQPTSGEMALEVVDKLVRSAAVGVIVVDSVAALVPQTEIEGDIGLIQVGAQARLMSQALRKLTANAAKANCTVVFLNQLRHKVGVFYGSPEVTSGGQALKFYSSVRLDIRRIEQIQTSGPSLVSNPKNIGGIKVRVKVVKNKCAPPYRQAEFEITFGGGINRIACLIDAAEEIGAVSRSGSWYSFGDIRLGQGKERACQFLRENFEIIQEIEKIIEKETLASISSWRNSGDEISDGDSDLREIVNEDSAVADTTIVQDTKDPVAM